MILCLIDQIIFLLLVVSGKGVKHELGGQEVIQRFFFGLCPACHSIGEHDDTVSDVILNTIV